MLFFIHKGNFLDLLIQSNQTQMYKDLVGTLQFDAQDTSTIQFHM
ncbi:hypothetical protein GGGNBK_11930 [Sporosarcina sp. ANT_H38]